MRREIRSIVTEAEYQEVKNYVVFKKRFKKMSHFVRYCVFYVMGQNPIGRHDNRGGGPTEGTGGNP